MHCTLITAFVKMLYKLFFYNFWLTNLLIITAATIIAHITLNKVTRNAPILIKQNSKLTDHVCQSNSLPFTIPCNFVFAKAVFPRFPCIFISAITSLVRSLADEEETNMHKIMWPITETYFSCRSTRVHAPQVKMLTQVAKPIIPYTKLMLVFLFHK